MMEVIKVRHFVVNQASKYILEEHRYDFVPYKRFKKWQYKVLEWLVKKGIFSKVYNRNTEVSSRCIYEEVDVKRIIEILHREVSRVMCDYREVDFIIMGRDIFRVISYGYYGRSTNPDSMKAWEFELAETASFMGCTIKVVPWFEGILVVPIMD